MLDLVIGSDQIGPPTLSARRRHDRARRPGPAAAPAPLRRQAGHRPGHLHGAGRQRRDDGRRRAAKARRTEAAISRSASRSAKSTSSPRPSPRPPTTSCSTWARRSRSSSSCCCSRWAARPGLIIGIVLFLTIMATFLVMYMKGDLLMERISLGALIIALCMLTDNAIIVIEGIKVGIEAGKDKLEVVREVVAQNQWPLFGATAIGVIAFAAIGLSEDSTGEYCNSLFWVILISLSLSWVSSITVTPLLSYLFFKPIAGASAAEPTIRTAASCSGFIAACWHWRCAFAGRWSSLSLVAFVAALYGFTQGRAELFPAGDAAAVHGRRLSAGRHAHPRNRRRLPTMSRSTSRRSPASRTSRRSSAAAACASCSSTRPERRIGPSSSSWSMSMTRARSTG